MKKLIFMAVALLGLCAAAFAAVDINKATQTELEAIKGLGPVKAKAIIDYRAKNGPFKAVDDLGKVKGFGAATIAKIGPELTIDGKALAVSKSAPAVKPTTAKKP